MFCLLGVGDKVSTEPDPKPVEDFHGGDEAEAEAEAEEAADVGDELKHGHPLRPLVLWGRFPWTA